jgi:hypothetical protein
LTITLAQIQQRCHHNGGNKCHQDDGKDACASKAKMPLQQGQQCHCNDAKDAYALMMTTTPLQWGQQHQLEGSNVAIAMRATTPSQIKGNDAIATRATTPAQSRQGRLCINNGNNTIVMRATIAIVTMAKMPAYWRQQCHHNKGNNASLTTSNEGNDASLTTAEKPVRQQWQQCHCDKSNNRHCNNSKDACTLMATTPS